MSLSNFMDGKAKSKYEIIKEVSELTGQSIAVTRDVLDAWTDVCNKEIVVRGKLVWPNLFSIKRRKKDKQRIYLADKDISIQYEPSNYFLAASVAQLPKDLNRQYFRSLICQEHGINNPEDWWKPFYLCDGDWRDKKEELGIE